MFDVGSIGSIFSHTQLMYCNSLIKALLRAWKVLERQYFKSGNSLDEIHREEISQPVVKN